MKELATDLLLLLAVVTMTFVFAFGVPFIVLAGALKLMGVIP